MGTASFIKDEAEFDALLNGESLLVVDFTATWCGPCKMVSPLVDQLADEYGDRANVFKLDMDINKPVGNRFGIKNVPSVMFFKGGELKKTLVGVQPYTTLSKAAEELM